MEVILLKKVGHLGELGEKVSVRSGYGRNFLIPSGYAVPATEANLKAFEERRAELEKEAAESLAAAESRREKLDGLTVTVETDISRGLPGFHLVGLPSAAVRESRQRVLAALRHSGVRVPPGHITVNLAPADVRKEGASFDLAIALGVVAAAERPGAGALRNRERETLFVGELSLFGELKLSF